MRLLQARADHLVTRLPAPLSPSKNGASDELLRWEVRVLWYISPYSLLGAPRPALTLKTRVYHQISSRRLPRSQQ